MARSRRSRDRMERLVAGAVLLLIALAAGPAGADDKPAAGRRFLGRPASGAVPGPPYRLADNPSSWLGFTDLVFVDPVGTGFSHGKGKEDNPDKPFWNVHSDLNSLGAVLRRWLSRHDRWNSPVYLVGESYGGLRAAALARTLVRDVGVTVTGLALVFPALGIAILHPDISKPRASA